MQRRRVKKGPVVILISTVIIILVVLTIFFIPKNSKNKSNTNSIKINKIVKKDASVSKYSMRDGEQLIKKKHFEYLLFLEKEIILLVNHQLSLIILNVYYIHLLVHHIFLKNC